LRLEFLDLLGDSFGFLALLGLLLGQATAPIHGTLGRTFHVGVGVTRQTPRKREKPILGDPQHLLGDFMPHPPIGVVCKDAQQISSGLDLMARGYRFAGPPCVFRAIFPSSGLWLK
jgi:hypothetical protein